MIEYLDSILITPNLRDNRTNNIIQAERMDEALINLNNIHIINDATGVFYLECTLPVIAIYYNGATAPVHYQDDYRKVAAALKKYRILQEKNKLIKLN